MKNIKTLVVEDDQMMAFLHKEVVKSNKISSAPLSFLNGKEALDFLLQDEETNSHYLILLDLNMPVMNGWDFLEEVEKLDVKDRIKVAIVTSSIDPTDRKKAEKYDTVELFMSKPLLDLSPIKGILQDLKVEK